MSFDHLDDKSIVPRHLSRANRADAVGRMLPLSVRTGRRPMKKNSGVTPNESRLDDSRDDYRRSRKNGSRRSRSERPACESRLPSFDCPTMPVITMS